MNSKKILITGATGFVGSALLARLIEAGQCQKIIATHRSPLAGEIRQRFGAAVEWLKVDLCVDELTEAVADIDTVFHLAGHFPVSDSDAERNLLDQINVVGTRRLSAAAKSAGVHHFIFVSSIAACEAGTPLPIDESNGTPISAYGQSKKSAEALLSAEQGDGFEITILRPTALFGENHLGSVYELVKAISRKRFVIFGHGANRTNFYYISDFIDVLMAVQSDARSYGQIFIAADQPCPMQELVTAIVKALGYQRSIPRVPLFMGHALAAVCDMATAVSGKTLPFSRRRLRAMTRDTAYSSRKLIEALNISPACGISEGIVRTVSWYRQNGLIE